MAKLISVYLNGTDEASDFNAQRITSLANLLHELTVQDNNNLSICLHGCGINNPYIRDLGGIFTWHLEEQIQDLEAQIRNKLGHEKIILNIYGFSRGGAGAYWLASKLKDIPSEQLEINILAFEAVPGNFINNVYVDKAFALNLSLSSQIADLRDCHNIRRVYSLYTNIPLPDIACHGPILPALPVCEAKVDILPGCHKGSELFTITRKSTLSGDYLIDNIEGYNDESALAFHQVVKFLKACGTKFNFDKYPLSDRLKENAPLEQMYEDMAKKLIWKKEFVIGFDAAKDSQYTTRAMHFSNKIYARPTVDKKYLNLFHQELANAASDPKNCILFIEDDKPMPSYANGQKTAAQYLYPFLIGSVAALFMLNRIKNRPRI